VVKKRSFLRAFWSIREALGLMFRYSGREKGIVLAGKIKKGKPQ
jgi:hypothetical protein